MSVAFPVLGTRPSLWQKKQASGVKVDSLTHQRKCPFAFHDPRLGEIKSDLLDCIPMEQGGLVHYSTTYSFKSELAVVMPF